MPGDEWPTTSLHDWNWRYWKLGVVVRLQKRLSGLLEEVRRGGRTPDIGLPWSTLQVIDIHLPDLPLWVRTLLREYVTWEQNEEGKSNTVMTKNCSHQMIGFWYDQALFATRRLIGETFLKPHRQFINWAGRRSANRVVYRIDIDIYEWRRRSILYYTL